ncbi:MobA/MobL family protein [Tahibacter aquaticus]|uniref:MobA/MobL family protein n=2 Tax=Tahibacter aquaticus TaxID=520092 RepID=A0A4R6Z288_9GAMM|nr:MobA/MobL family protein [Tahibacter aquaticus]
MSQLLVGRYSVAVMAAIHEPGKGGDDRNHHCHLLMTTRVVGLEGFGAKVRLLDDQATGPVEVKALRESIALLINQHLAGAGKSARVDPRSLVAQAEEAAERGDMEAVARLVRVPQRHEGKAATAARRRGESSGARDANSSIRTDNRALAHFARLRTVELRQEIEAKNRAGIDRKRRPRRSRPAGLPTPRPHRPRRLPQESRNPYLAALAETVALMKRQAKETLRLGRRRGHELERELREARLRGDRARLHPTDRWDTDLWRTAVDRESRQTSAGHSVLRSPEALPAPRIAPKTIDDVSAADPVLASERIALSDPPSAEVTPAPQACTEAVERVQSVVGEVRHREFPENKNPESVRRTASQRQEHSPQSSQPQNRRQWAELRRRQRAAGADHAKEQKGIANAPFPGAEKLPSIVFPDSTVDSLPIAQQPTVPAKPRRPRPR